MAFNAPLLQQLSPAGRERFLQHLEHRTLKPRAAFLQEGDACTSLLFVETGALRVFKTSEEGREITLYRVRPGELCILSLSSLLARTPYPASVAADGVTTVWALEAENFRALHASEPSLQREVAAELHRLLTGVMALVSEVAFKRVDERLAALVLEETAREGVLATTHDRLARHLGTAREVVSRLLENLSDDGVLEVERGHLRVVNRAALEQLARRP